MLKDEILKQKPDDLIRDAIVSSSGIYQPGDPQEKPLRRLLDEIAETPVEPNPNLVLVGWYGWYSDECQSGTRLPGVEVGLFRSSDLLSLQRIPDWDVIDTVLDNPNVKPGQLAFEHLQYEDIERLCAFHCSVCELPWPRELEITLSASVAPGVDSGMIGEALSRMLSSQMCPQKKQWREWEQEQCEALFSPELAACRSCRGSRFYTEISRYQALKYAAEAVSAE